MSEDVAISVRNVCKHYQIYQRPEDRLKQAIIPRLQRLLGRPQSRYFTDFIALRNISFDVPRGQVVGIVGRNGSGKSTLLQIICGTLQPSDGEVMVNGRIGALLELGAGFNPEFTGRENVYMNATILGLSRAEIDARLEDILEFADIGSFIDQPVKTYSSGMYMRLAFAVAINIDPEILVIDEALAVGDVAFQRKCFAQIEQIRAKGATILLVSHSIGTILELCDRAIMLDEGELLMDGTPEKVTFYYERLLDAPAERRDLIREAIRQGHIADKAHDDLNEPPEGEEVDRRHPFPRSMATTEENVKNTFNPVAMNRYAKAYPPDGAEITQVRLVDMAGEDVTTLRAGEEYAIVSQVRFFDDQWDVGFSVTIKTVSGLVVAGVASGCRAATRLHKAGAGQLLEVHFPFRCLLTEGAYFINCGVVSRGNNDRRVLHRLVDILMFQVVEAPGSITTGLVDLGLRPRWKILDSNMASGTTMTASDPS